MTVKKRLEMCLEKASYFLNFKRCSIFFKNKIGNSIWKRVELIQTPPLKNDQVVHVSWSLLTCLLWVHFYQEETWVAVTHYMALLTHRGNNGRKLSNCEVTVCSPDMAQGTIQIYWNIIKLLSLSFIQVSYYVFSIFLVGWGFCTSYFKRDKDGHSRQWAVPEENESSRLWRQKWSNKLIYHILLPPFSYFWCFLHNACFWDRKVPISSI